jgi:hypothetical protein
VKGKVVYGRKVASVCLSMLGMASLSFVIGGVVMFFHLPSSGWLTNALVGAQTWYDRPEPHAVVSKAGARPSTRAAVHKPEKTFDGFTLFACEAGSDLGTQAFLINMQRDVVHRWAIPFSQLRPESDYVKSRRNDSWACFFGTHIYPNGDLLVVCHGPGTNSYCLAKLGKASNVLWAYPAAIHHDVDVAEDGTIYALQQEVFHQASAVEGIVTPCLDDLLIALSPDGKPLRQPISIVAALHDSPYSALLAPLERPVEPHRPPAGSTAPRIAQVSPERDELHTNCVRVLRRDVADKFPNFRPGHVLVSVRNLSVIAMFDPVRGCVTWATRGPWVAQHDPQFLDNGHLLIFDNLGSPKGSRVLEFDPQTEAVPWSYSAENDPQFYTSERGMSQRLPNGNTFIVNSEGGDLIEVTHDHEIVWTCSLGRFVTTARRYAADQVPFLDASHLARP